MEQTVQRLGLPADLIWLYSHHDYNLYAAFPSLHAGFPVLAATAAWRLDKRAGAALSIWAIVVWVAVVYLGEHYVADVAGGILYAAVALAIVTMVSRTGTDPNPQADARPLEVSPDPTES
jgi:membrane-associated phospholipid phosphatase